MARQRGTSWQADAVIDGKRVRKSFPTEARAIAWEKANAITAPRQAVVEETISSLAGSLEIDLWGRGEWAMRAQQVIRETVATITDLPIKDFRTTHVHKLTSKWLEDGLSDASINRRYAILSKLCRRAVEAEMLDRLPLFKRRKEPKGRDRYLTPEEEDRLFAALRGISEADHDLVLFLVDTGCRLGEAFSLQWYQLDLKKGSITFDKTKADVTRTVYATERVRKLLEGRKSLSAPFADINRYTFRDHWNRAKTIAGFGDDPDIVPHILRHTCASRVVGDGLSLKLAQTQLGHKNATTTERYSHLAPDVLKGVVDTLERRGQRA